jgi:Tol biopolymer transport system component
LLAALPAASATRQLPAGKLALVLSSGSGNWIEAQDLDGSNRRAITARLRKGEQRSDVDPVWSPDGSQIAFVRASEKRSAEGVYIARSDGSGLRQVFSVPASELNDNGPAWSPDGRELAFTVARNGQECDPNGPGFTKPSNVRGVIVPLHGRKVIDVPAIDVAHSRGNHNPVWMIAWSPDGARLLYIVSQWDKREECRFRPPAGSLLYTIRADGTGRRLAVPTDAGLAAAWSPRGNRVAYPELGSCSAVRPYRCSGGLSIVGADGGTKTVVNRSDCEPGLVWVPAGLLCAIGSPVPGAAHGVYLVNERTKKRRLLTRAAIGDIAYDLGPGFRGVSHDGRTVAFVAYTNESRTNVATYLVTLEGKKWRLPFSESVFLS